MTSWYLLCIKKHNFFQLVPKRVSFVFTMSQLLVESVAANVQQVSGEVEEAEKQLSSQALQPLQAVLETFKMVKTASTKVSLL